jgi:hypothetical protein
VPVVPGLVEDELHAKAKRASAQTKCRYREFMAEVIQRAACRVNPPVRVTVVG